MLNLLIAGGRGQLGRALQKAYFNIADTIKVLDLPEWDILRDIPDMGMANVSGASHWSQVLINCAAVTDVDGCEANPELAYQVNAQAAGRLAQVAKDSGAIFVQISTDYVFDGAGSQPYTETTVPNPQSVYGRSKWQGEQQVQAVGGSYYIVRSAGLYGQGGAAGKGGHTMIDFVLKQARLNQPLKLVIDQYSSPTFVNHLAEGIAGLLQSKAPYGLYHMVNEGGCNWYEFGQEVLRQAGQLGKIQPAQLADFSQRPAARPVYSVLANTKLHRLGISMPSWQQGIEDYLKIQTKLPA